MGTALKSLWCEFCCVCVLCIMFGCVGCHTLHFAQILFQLSLYRLTRMELAHVELLKIYTSNANTISFRFVCYSYGFLY